MAPTSILSASARSLERMVSFLERNALVPVVDASVGFNEVDAALELLAASPVRKGGDRPVEGRPREPGTAMNTLITGALLSLSLCLDIGIGNVAIMDVSLKFGSRPGWYFGLGSIVGDLVYAALSVMGMGLLLHIRMVQWACWLGGGLTMCWLAVKMARAAMAASQATTSSSSLPTPTRSRLFARGIAIALASPSSMLWFAAVGGGLIAQATDGSPAEVAKFLFGFFIGGLAWCAFLITATTRAGVLLGHRFIQGAHLASAILYVYFAITVLTRGARELL